MSVAREARFSEQDKLLIHNANTVLKVNTVNVIKTLECTRIKPGILDSTLDTSTSRYCFPHPLPWKNIVTIYLHSVTLARVMSQTINLRIDRLSVTHIIDHTCFTCNIKHKNL